MGAAAPFGAPGVGVVNTKELGVSGAPGATRDTLSPLFGLGVAIIDERIVPWASRRESGSPSFESPDFPTRGTRSKSVPAAGSGSNPSFAR